VILNSHFVAGLLADPDPKDPLVLAPMPEIAALRQTGAASIDLRLGTWFVSVRATKHELLRLTRESHEIRSEQHISAKSYVRFDSEFILHPGAFVLAATLEWIRMPRNLAGYVSGKSSWGRRGLVIETAPGVHPGFLGCLTLELANVGEIPIALSPGTPICQLFLHKVEGDTSHADRSAFVGRRQPIMGNIKMDNFVKKLRQG
jgi:dCTP deaminase